MSSSNQDIPREHWPEAAAIAKKCGCVCHTCTAMHCFPCCEATYFRLDLMEMPVVVPIEPNMGYFHCHCGWTTPYHGGAYADPPICAVCGCYTMSPGETTGCWSTADNCMVEKRKKYPYLRSVVDFISKLPHKMNSYVRLKVGQGFNLTPDEVDTTFREIDEMNQVCSGEGNLGQAGIDPDVV